MAPEKFPEKMNVTLRSVQLFDETVEVWTVSDFEKYLDEFVTEISQGVRETNSCPFGSLLWPSSRALWKWFRTAPASQDAVYRLPFEEAVELGCGVGMLSCLLPRLGVKKVFATDYEMTLLPLVELNRKQMGVESAVEFQTLDWTKPAPAEWKSRFSCVVASDVLYDDTHINNLPRMAWELLRPDGVFYLADPQRFRFQTALENLEKYFESICIHEVDVENQKEDAAFGLVQKDKTVTRVNIMECRAPGK